jgi:hypothetical protein
VIGVPTAALLSDNLTLADTRISAMPTDLTRAFLGLRDRGFTRHGHAIAQSGPCKGHACDDCSTCRGGTCCGSLPVKIYREGNPALSPELHGPATAEPGAGA